MEDNGLGLRQEDARRIFDPFYTTKEPGRGTGLGRAGAARQIAGLGGMFGASGRPESGAVFSIALPAIEETRG